MNIEEIVAEGVNKFNNKYKEFSKKCKRISFDLEQNKIDINNDDSLADSLSKHDRDELDALIKSYQKAIKELEKQDFDISKHSKKNLDNHALCKFILTESKTLKADDHSKFDKETEKYDKK